MKKNIILIGVISILLTGCGNAYRESLENNDENVTTTTEKVKENSTTSTTTTTTTTTTKKKSAYKKIGSSKLYYGKYKGDFDTNEWKATITINEDGTATYVGHMYVDGVKKKVDVKGTWDVEAKAIIMSDFDKTKYDGVYFTWSNGVKEAYALSTKFFGDQWHSFDFVK